MASKFSKNGYLISTLACYQKAGLMKILTKQYGFAPKDLEQYDNSELIDLIMEAQKNLDDADD